MAFETREAAGAQLATHLRAYAGSDAVVLGLTRGGVVVGHAAAQALHLPFDILVIHKFVAPGRSQRPVGVLAEPDHLVVHEDRLRALGLSSGWLEGEALRGLAEVRQRAAAYRRSGSRQILTGHPVIVVDDAAATGATLRAAVQAARASEPRELVVAVPIAPPSVIAALRPHVDRVVCLATPAEVIWGDSHYPRPGEVTDEEIQRLVQRVAPDIVALEIQAADLHPAPGAGR